MPFLHAFLLVFSLTTIAPLMIVFSMIIPTAPLPDESAHRASFPEIPLTRQYRRPQARQQAPAPLPRPF